MNELSQKTNRYRWIIWVQLSGFALIIVLFWANKIFNFSHWITGLQHHGQKAALHNEMVETIIVVLVAAMVFLLTNRIAKRLDRLEQFIRICSWCGNVKVEGQWVTMNTYLQAKHDLTASHGICPPCLVKAKKDLGKEEASSV